LLTSKIHCSAKLGITAVIELDVARTYTELAIQGCCLYKGAGLLPTMNLTDQSSLIFRGRIKQHEKKLQESPNGSFPKAAANLDVCGYVDPRPGPSSGGS
jgi:hypothetical protein